MDTESVSLVEALLLGKTYANIDGNEGMWGDVTGINWCETNYAVTKYVAEFWNTFSNMGFIIAGIYTLTVPHLPKRYVYIGIGEILLGLLSGLFHATLWYSTQKADEVIENWVLAALYHSDNADQRIVVLHCILCTIGILFLTFFLFCEIHLVSLAIIAMKKVYDLKGEVPASAKSVVVMNTALTVAAACWLTDRILCNNFIRNFQLHAVWHLLCALGIHQATMLSIVHHMQKKKDIRLVDNPGFSTVEIVTT